MVAPLNRSREVLTPDQAADYLQVNKETIYRYIRDGKLLASKLGRAYRIPRASLDSLMLATSTRPQIKLRKYSREEKAQFLKDDELTGKAAEIADAVRLVMDKKSAR